jgi:ubiquinone/menaquinone biosynthesis C-methylase UbiE
MASSIIKTGNFKEIFGNIDGGRILDVACGIGQFIEILQNFLRSWDEIFGLDIDDYYISEARKRFSGDRYRFIRGNSEKIPCQDNDFNLVSISNGLHHIDMPELTLKEMKRVLKPGGYFVINEMLSDELTESQISQKLYHHCRVEMDRILGKSHFYTFEKNEIIRFAEKLKLSDLAVYEFNEEQNDPLNRETIREYSEKLDFWLEQIRDHEKYDNLRRNIRELKERFGKFGITRPPQLVVLGRKPASQGVHDTSF